MATASVIGRFPARIIRQLHTSRAAADTTRRRSTANGRTTTRTTWTGWRRNTTRPRTRAAAGNRVQEGREDRLPRLWHNALGHHRIAGSASEGIQACRSATTGCELFPSRSIWSSSSRSTIGSTSSNRIATRQMASLIKLELSPELGAKIRSILHYSGLPIDARFVTDAVIAAEKGEKK